MDSRTFLPATVCALVLSFCAASSAQAATINVTYAYSVSAVSGDPLNPPIIGVGTGSVNPLGSMTWMDIITDPNPATGEAVGTFTMTFSTGDTLFGDLHEQLDLSSLPIVPFTQILTVTGGTGALLSYRGTLTGGGIGNLAENIFLASRHRNAEHDSGTRVGRLVRDGAGVLACVPKARTPIPVG